MNIKTHIVPVNFIGHVLKIFLSKLTQNPEYYNIKHYSKMKRRQRQQQTMW
ncbi:MAG: hypothetical protein ABI237_06290 [Ginsengibacter sp.]